MAYGGDTTRPTKWMMIAVLGLTTMSIIAQGINNQRLGCIARGISTCYDLHGVYTHTKRQNSVDFFYPNTHSIAEKHPEHSITFLTFL